MKQCVDKIDFSCIRDTRGIFIVRSINYPELRDQGHSLSDALDKLQLLIEHKIN